ncbi:MAG TPA: MFS transporter [Candidatus Baltobacteraceae bacterium]|nr:MFS transporter [Candidatus Baltobacteraceae bacterium]
MNLSTNTRRWVVLAAVFLNLALLYGIWYSYAVFLVALLQEFHWSRSVLAGAFSVFILVNGAISPIVGWMAGRLGARRVMLFGGVTLVAGLFLAAHTSVWWHLYVAFGLIASIGLTSAGWLPSIIVVRAWFLDRVGMAVGVVSAGIGVGIAFVVPLMQYSIGNVGWRWTFRLVALAVVIWMLPATFALIREAAPEYIPPDTTNRPAWRDALGAALRDRRYWYLGGVYAFGNMVTQLLFVHQIAYLVDHGVAVLAAASVAGVAGMASIVGKVGWGSLSDRYGRELAYSWAMACLVASVGVLVLAGQYPESLLPFVYAVLFGLGYAGSAALTPAATSDLFAGPGFSTIFGTFQTILAVGAAGGAWLAGKIFDVTGSYSLALWLALAGSLAAPALMWLAAPSRALRVSGTVFPSSPLKR